MEIPFCLSWVSQSTIHGILDVNSYVPSFSEFELLIHKPVQWALQRTLQRSILIGKELFFGLNYNNDSNALKSKFPFFLWTLANKILTNDAFKLTNKIYDLGEFALDDIIDDHKQNMKWISNLLPSNPNIADQSQSEQDKKIVTIDYPIKVLWRRIFGIKNYFKDCKIYWIEDKSNALKRAEFIEGPIGEPVDEKLFTEGNINIHLLKDENTAQKIKNFKTYQEFYIEFDKLVADNNFNIFIIDMYFQLKGDNKKYRLKIYGDNIISRLREKENATRLFKNLVVVFTHGSSPFIVSRSKALNADLVVFKKQLAIGGHSGEVVDAHCMLFWSIFWPLSVLRYICKLFQRIIDTKPADELKLLIERLNEEVGFLCHEGIFYFWQEWLGNVKRTLSKWNVILASHEASKANLDTLNQKLANLLKHAYFK